MLIAVDGVVRCLQGWQNTAHYTTPRVPWGINRDELEPTFRKWLPTLAEVTALPYWRFPRGVARYLFWAMQRAPWLRRQTPTVVRLCFGGK